MDEIDQMGGSIKALETGFQQNLISKSAYKYQMEIDSKERIVVGVNEFESKSNHQPKLQAINQIAVENQIKRLKIFKKNRDENDVNKSLNQLKQSIINNENLIPTIINCVESNITLGEISKLLKEHFGEYQS